MKDCIYSKVCASVNTEECNSICSRYVQMKYLLKSSGIPPIHLPLKKLKPNALDVASHEKVNYFIKNIEKNVEEGKNLFLWSETPGNGKSSLATKIMVAYFDKIWAGNGMTQRGYWCCVPRFFIKLKENISEDTDIQEVIESMKKSDIVVFDDIGTFTAGEWETEYLYTIIDYRVSNRKCSIYTSNVSPYNLKNKLGMRLHSRITNLSQIVEFKGPDCRGLMK